MPATTTLLATPRQYNTGMNQITQRHRPGTVSTCVTSLPFYLSRLSFLKIFLVTYKICLNVYEVETAHAWNQTRDLGVRPTHPLLENHKAIGFLSNRGLVPLKMHKLNVLNAAKPTLKIRPSSARKRNAI